ncbi:MAG: hypothetical protein HY660_06445 [Armatimonadetes bacterium]|nr:hypothetical protein [Armatimonadota bacterium]
MLRHLDLSPLIESDRKDIVSVALDIDPTKPEHQDNNPAYRIWLRNALRDTLEGLPKEERRAADNGARRILGFVEEHRALNGRGLAIFAGPDLWREYLLPVPLPNSARYGRPDVWPLLWAADEYEPCAVLAVFRDHARILMAYLGQTAVLDEEALVLDTSTWRFKAGRQPTFSRGTGVGASRGTQRDTFEARVEDHIRRFWAGVAEAAAHLVRESRIDRVVIGGPEEVASAVRDLLPDDVRARVVGIVHLPGYAGDAELRDRVLPVALAGKHRREEELVTEVLDRAAGRSGAVTGRPATLDALARKQVQILVVDRDVTGQVWQCGHCAFTSAVPITHCPTCGSPVEAVALPQVLPVLARRSGARISIVSGQPAARLRTHEGIGALLRYVTAAR